jgi:hypothetical protein
MFLDKKFLEKYNNFGIEIYEANEALAIFSNLSLDLSNNVVKTPCN